MCTSHSYCSLINWIKYIKSTQNGKRDKDLSNYDMNWMLKVKLYWS